MIRTVQSSETINPVENNSSGRVISACSPRRPSPLLPPPPPPPPGLRPNGCETHSFSGNGWSGTPFVGSQEWLGQLLKNGGNLAPKNIHIRSHAIVLFPPLDLFASLSPPLFFASRSFSSIKMRFAGRHFRQRIFIVNRFLPSPLPPPPPSSACLSSYGTRLAAIFIDFPRSPPIFICPFFHLIHGYAIVSQIRNKYPRSRTLSK